VTFEVEEQVTPVSRWRGGWTIERRGEPDSLILYRTTAMLLGLLIAFFIAPMLTDQGTDIYDQIWTATFGSPIGFENVLSLSAPLILTGLAAAIPYRVGLWNIGADGQMFIGGWMGAAVAFTWPDLSGPLLIPLMMIAAFAGGALWALVPALVRVFLGVSEIITTLLLNVVAVLWMTYWAAGPWVDVSPTAGVRSKSIPSSAEVTGVAVGDVLVPTGFLLAAGLAIVVWVILRYTTLGYATRIAGKSLKAAVYAGISAKKLLITTLLVGGAFAGLAGGLVMMGEIHRYSAALTTNTGYSGIVVAVIAAGSALGVLGIGFVFASMLVAGQALQVAGVSSDATLALVGMILLLAAIGDAFARFRLVRRNVEVPEPEAST
jgi:general nucleoside transport system permease protein